MTQEHQRLEENRERGAHWKRWGPYVTERQAGWTGLLAKLMQQYGQRGEEV